MLKTASKFAWLVFLTGALFTGTTFGQAGHSSGEIKLFHLLNQERASAGLPEFEWDSHLADSARAHTQIQAAHNNLSHQLPGEAVLGDRIAATGLRFDVVAENVAVGGSVEEIHQGFMDSPKHRSNILSPRYNAVGLSIVSGRDGLYVTEDFAHKLPNYSEDEFRDALIAAFNKERQSNRLALIPVHPDAQLRDMACSESNNAQTMLGKLPGAMDLVIFTSAVPEALSTNMKKTAADRSVHRMELGVCFRPSKDRGYASFRVVAAFYP